MARYKLLAKHFVNNSIHEEGEIVEYDGKPGQYMELVEDENKGRAKAKKGADAPASEEASE